jgi:hypothetical protein
MPTKENGFPLLDLSVNSYEIYGKPRTIRPSPIKKSFSVDMHHFYLDLEKLKYFKDIPQNSSQQANKTYKKFNKKNTT